VCGLFVLRSQICRMAQTSHLFGKWHHLGIIFFKRVVFFWLTQRL
jgi:hypothetical protein